MPPRDTQNADVSLFPGRRGAACCAPVCRSGHVESGRSKQRPYVVVNTGGVSFCELCRGIFLFIFSLATAHAEEAPLWEIGAGFVGLSIPDYRGSDQQSGYVLPLPYIQYRGDVFRIDREGAHGDVFKSEQVKLDVSLNAGPPAKSGNNGARTGMPDIDPTVEAGPSLQIFLARNEARDREWSLRLPWRVAAATDLSHVQRIGWVFAPNLNLDVRNLGGGWDMSVGLGPMYASEDYHDYYYGSSRNRVGKNSP